MPWFQLSLSPSSDPSASTTHKGAKLPGLLRRRFKSDLPPSDLVPATNCHHQSTLQRAQHTTAAVMRAAVARAAVARAAVARAAVVRSTASNTHGGAKMLISACGRRQERGGGLAC
eukprot:365951-Chlamydomonas_euryale.AAC.8